MRPTLFTLLAAALAACIGDVDDPASSGEPVPGHDDGGFDPYAAIERARREGPPRFTSRVHSCAKLRYRTFGTVLASRGVDVTVGTEPTQAGAMYRAAAFELGAPRYLERVRETGELGLSTAAKQFDIWVQAAPEIIARIGAGTACPGAQLFTADGQCVAAGITCLIGVPATPVHVDICNQTVARATDREAGKRLAVAVLAAAAHTCE